MMNPHNLNGEAGSCDRCAAFHTLTELLELNKRMISIYPMASICECHFCKKPCSPVYLIDTLPSCQTCWHRVTCECGKALSSRHTCFYGMLADYRNGLLKKGLRETKLRRLVSDSDKVKILKLKAMGIKHEFIAKRFGLAVSTVSRIRHDKDFE